MPSKPKSQLKPEVKTLFTGTEVGALLEDVDQKLGMIVDSQKGLGQRMDILESGVNGLEKRMTRLEVKVDTLTDTVGDIKIELTEVNDKLDRKADRSEVSELQSRVSVLEVR